MAIQFLATVGRDVTFRNRPKQSPTKQELIVYTLQQELMETASLNSYSGNTKFHLTSAQMKVHVQLLGWLQVQFLAGSLKKTIHQVAEDEHLDLYNVPLFPCSCEENMTDQSLTIMWVRGQEPIQGETLPINHIVPLVPGSGQPS